MSEKRIYLKGDGILETHVHWEDVEKALQTSFASTSKMRIESEIVDITGGNAALSRTGMVQVSWTPKMQILPTVFVLKISSLLNDVESEKKSAAQKGIPCDFIGSEDCLKRELDLIEFHNKEVRFYELFEIHQNADDLKVPRFYAAERFTETNKSKGFIVMEYLGNYKGIKNLNYHQLDETLKALVKLKKIGHTFSETDKAYLKAGGFSDVWNYLVLESYHDEFKENLMRMFGNSDPELVETVKELLPILLQPEFMKFIDFCDDLKVPLLFNHADCHEGNILWESDQSIKGIIDFQLSHFGNPAFDLAYICTSCLDQSLRSKWPEHLEKFYNFAQEANICTFSKETFEECFLRAYPLLCLFKGSEIAEDCAEEDPSFEEDKVRARGFLKEFIQFHSRNVRIFEEFSKSLNNK